MTAGPVALQAQDAERQRRIMDAAGKLFARNGYDTTGVGEIAAEARLGPATIYRLVGTKQDLLGEVIVSSLSAAVEGLMAIDPGADDGLEALAGLAMRHRHLGVLWQRDIRHLTVPVQATARSLIRQFAARMRVQVRIRRPELGDTAVDVLGWAMVAAMISPSLHQVAASADAYHRRIAVILGRLLAAPIPPDLPAAAAAPTPRANLLLPASRREALLVAAVRLFAERGYADVALDDIGAAVGVSGPSIYHHFPGKQHLLTTAASRAAAVLRTSVSGAYLASAGPADALAALLASYTRFAVVHHELLSLLITESTHLPAQARERAAATEGEYIGEWAHLLSQHRRDGDDAGCLIDVYAVLDIVNNIVRIPRLRANAAVARCLPELGCWVLQVP